MAFLGVVQAVVLVITAGLHHAALVFGLYWLYPWFDIPVHFFGGLWVGLLALWVFALYAKRARSVSATALVVGIMSSVVVVGGLWELFEYTLGLVPSSSARYLRDTITDGAMDLFGGGVAALYGRSFWKSTRTGEVS